MHSVINGIMAVMILIILGNVWLSPAKQQQTANLDGKSNTQEHSIAAIALPVRLRIPNHDIDASIESVGLTAEGNMGIPNDAWTVGWYHNGVSPGSQGNAVLAGHKDTSLGTPGIFWTLDAVQEGERMFVELDNREVHQFRVYRTEEFPYDTAPLEEIFGATDKHLLKLITCAGSWTRTTYDRRLVIYAERMDTEKLSAVVD